MRQEPGAVQGGRSLFRFLGAILRLVEAHSALATTLPADVARAPSAAC